MGWGRKEVKECIEGDKGRKGGFILECNNKNELMILFI